MRYSIFILFSLIVFHVQAQQRSAFMHLSMEDGSGLASNVVNSLYQDRKGFIWVGTSNGLQRFDGSKFVSFHVEKTGFDELPKATINQIIPADSGRLILAANSLREFGIFDPGNFTYRKIRLLPSHPIPSRGQFRLWRTTDNHIYLNVLGYGFMVFDSKKLAFVDDDPFQMPAGWRVSLSGMHEDILTQRYWIAADSGICIFDKRTRQLWTHRNNPLNLPALKNPVLQENITEIYIDQQRRLWAFGWPSRGGGQVKYCFDSSGRKNLEKDTAGLLTGPVGYTEYTGFYEPSKSGLWIFGSSVLFNWQYNLQRFYFHKSTMQGSGIGINYDIIFQLLEDRDGGLWFATDRGLYFTALGSDTGTIVNLIFRADKTSPSITDILEMPDGGFWFASWGEGVRSLDRLLRPVENHLYKTQIPRHWPAAANSTVKLTWSLCRESGSGNIWVGCNDGIVLIHDPVSKSTTYLQPPELRNKTVRFIAEDKNKNIWLGTQGGSLVCWDGKSFQTKLELATIIYKIFVDTQGWLWLATHEKGLYAIDPGSGEVLQHYSAGANADALYSNTAFDIEQLNDSTIIYGAGVLNFINKKSGRVRLLTYNDGLPSNNVLRLRTDHNGFLWIVTSNGLCRYNPHNNRITPYGRKDGVLMAELTNVADYASTSGELLFGGSNAVIKFDPGIFMNSKPPPDVAITDFQLFSRYLPVDSLLTRPRIRFRHDQNSFNIHFASLSYVQNDKLTYYYKLEGVDEVWQRADRSYFVSYNSLQPGDYLFKVYCENIEGIRSVHTSEMHFRIKPPFWRTWWFRISVLFLIALVIYDIHSSRVKRLLAVEKLRNKVARDLHDDMGSTLSTINILAAMAKAKMDTDMPKTTEFLSKISDNSQRMMEAMDDIVWSIKPANDSIGKVMARMREFATSVLEAKDIDFDFVADEKITDVKLNMEARKDLFLIFKEAINNAAKYSAATKVTVSIQVQQRHVVLTVTDNGIGFDVFAADSGNGLGNMRKRADGIGATMKIESSQNRGTLLHVKIPVE